MLNVVILWIFSCGIELGVIVLCLLPLRFILRRKVPRLFSYLLWAAVPVTVVFSLIMQFTPKSSLRIIKRVFEKMPIKVNESSLEILRWIWVIGTAVIIITMLLSYIRFQRCLIGSIRLRKNVYITSRISSPFSIGLLQPKVYLPTAINDEYYESVILHEQIHIQRKDIWMKHLAVIFLAVFWFQPLLWCGYRLFINDMEEACDEAVLRKMGDGFSKEYAKALVEISYQSGKIQGVAIGYGNGEVRARIRNIMNYKQTSSLFRFIMMCLCIFFVIMTVLISIQVPYMVQNEQEVIDVKSNLFVNELKIEKVEIVE